jgi:16S rRNA (uracil1498-N3)-methyltransferase
VTADHFFIARRDIAGARGRIAGAEHHHLSRVARLRAGDAVRLFDECGALYSARVEKIGPGATELVILTAEEPESPRTRITLGQAVLKAKAMEEVVEKAAEIGVFAIAPFFSRRSVVKPGRGGGSPTERWARIALAAAKQSHSGRLPRILAPVPLSSLLAERASGLKLVLTEQGGTPFRDILTDPDPSRPDEVILLVGPEGGWEPAEVEEILASGYRSVSLGRTILRAGTAAVLGAAMALHFWTD